MISMGECILRSGNETRPVATPAPAIDVSSASLYVRIPVSTVYAIASAWESEREVGHEPLRRGTRAGCAELLLSGRDDRDVEFGVVCGEPP